MNWLVCLFVVLRPSFYVPLKNYSAHIEIITASKGLKKLGLYLAPIAFELGVVYSVP